MVEKCSFYVGTRMHTDRQTDRHRMSYIYILDDNGEIILVRPMGEMNSLEIHFVTYQTCYDCISKAVEMKMS